MNRRRDAVLLWNCDLSVYRFKRLTNGVRQTRYREGINLPGRQPINNKMKLATLIRILENVISFDECNTLRIRKFNDSTRRFG